MNLDSFQNYAERCFRDTPPPCTCLCPLNLDVRGFMEKIQRGNLTAAYKQYRNQVLFPAIVSLICPEPCREACTRKELDTAIFMRKLEAACVAFTRNAEPVAFNVPAKPFSIAVIGAGLCGLSCALKMASRNYKVIVYEQKNEPGGQLWDILEPEVFLEEIRLQFSSVEYELVNGFAINGLDDIKADAIFIATGKDGDDFGLLQGLDTNSLGTVRPGVFLGGSLLGVSLVQSIEHGVRASYSIEKFLKVKAMDGMPETYEKPVANPKYYSLPLEPFPAKIDDAQELTQEQAVEESKRCPRCNCSLCFDSCELMQWAKSYPQGMVAKVVASLGPKESLTQRRGLRMLNACTQCGLCRDICPEGVDMEKCLLEARRSLCEDAVQPPVYHDFWLRDMCFSMDQARFTYFPEAGQQKSSRLFFPGCQLGASNPDYVIKTYEYLLGKYPDMVLLQSCCGVPADWAGEVTLRDGALAIIDQTWEKAGKPLMILACPTCQKTFSRYLPHIPIQSLYTLLGDEYEEAPMGKADPVCIYDPCSSRENESLKTSIRALATRIGLEQKSVPAALVNNVCCGFGGHTHMVDHALHKSILLRRIEASPDEYLTYCANCRDGFASLGKPCRHILDVLFTGEGPNRCSPGLSKRRYNRFLLKVKYTGGVLDMEKPAIQLRISESLREKMNDLLLLEEEVAAVVSWCDAENAKFLHKSTGQYSGCKQLGCVTCWVAWHEEEGVVVLDNVYTHRMNIQA